MKHYNPERNMRNPAEIPPITLTEVIERVTALKALLERQVDRSYEVAEQYTKPNEGIIAKAISDVASVASIATLELDFIQRELEILRKGGELSVHIAQPLQPSPQAAERSSNKKPRKPRQKKRRPQVPGPAPWA